jgi:hypothetical protein
MGLGTSTSMRHWMWSSLVALSTLGCLQQVTTGPGSDPTAAGASDGGPSGSGGPMPMGTGCSTDPQTGVTLCSGVDTCPTVAVDPSAWPGCGFRVAGGTALDLECLCANSICPIGVATTCSQASQLLSAQNELSVCQQVSESRCTSVPTAPEAGTVPPGCDRNCQIGCGTAPDCLQVCGC